MGLITPVRYRSLHQMQDAKKAIGLQVLLSSALGLDRGQI